MVRVDLETQEAEELRAILENYLSDLRMEIVDTEGHDYREMLKNRRDLVGRLIEQLIEQLKAQKATIEDWNHQLRLERASLADPQRIDRLAQKELGLAVPSPHQVIRVGPASEPEGSVLARNMATVGGGQGGLTRGQ